MGVATRGDAIRELLIGGRLRTFNSWHTRSSRKTIQPVTMRLFYKLDLLREVKVKEGCGYSENLYIRELEVNHDKRDVLKKMLLEEERKEARQKERDERRKEEQDMRRMG